MFFLSQKPPRIKLLLFSITFYQKSNICVCAWQCYFTKITLHFSSCLFGEYLLYLVVYFFYCGNHGSSSTQHHSNTDLFSVFRPHLAWPCRALLHFHGSFGISPSLSNYTVHCPPSPSCTVSHSLESLRGSSLCTMGQSFLCGLQWFCLCPG